MDCIPGALGFSVELFVVKDRTCRFLRRGGKSVGILVDLENAKSEQNASATLLCCSCRLSIPSIGFLAIVGCKVELHHSIRGPLSLNIEQCFFLQTVSPLLPSEFVHAPNEKTSM
jgi:hypothetical protein